METTTGSQNLRSPGRADDHWVAAVFLPAAAQEKLIRPDVRVVTSEAALALRPAWPFTAAMSF